jgi:hypothetical protein
MTLQSLLTVWSFDPLVLVSLAAAALSTFAVWPTLPSLALAHICAGGR